MYGETLRLAIAKTPAEVVTDEGKQILVASFMGAYEDVPLAELNPDFKSTGDVRSFYHFKNGSLIWVQAFIREKLVG